MADKQPLSARNTYGSDVEAVQCSTNQLPSQFGDAVTGLSGVAYKQPLSSISTFGSDLQAGQCSTTQLPDLVMVSSCEPRKVSSIFSAFDCHKASLVRTIGFGGLLELPHLSMLNDHLSLWLYERYDDVTRSLKLDGGSELAIRPVDVNLIFGIPFEGQDVHYATTDYREIINMFTSLYFNDSASASLTLSVLEHILTKEYGSGWSEVEKNAFKIAVVLFSMSYLLAPGPQHDFPAPLVNNFIPQLKIRSMNWAELVLSTLGQACKFARSQMHNGNKHIVLFGCSLLLQVFYLDNLNFGPSSPYHVVLPRSKVFRHNTISELTELDCICVSDQKLMLFGKSEVRDGNDVCYSRGWADFIEIYSRHTLTTEDKFVASIETLSQALQLLDQLHANANLYTASVQSSIQDQVAPAVHCNQKVAYNLNRSIDTLYAKAAWFLRSYIIKLYYRHMPDRDEWLSEKLEKTDLHVVKKT